MNKRITRTAVLLILTLLFTIPVLASSDRFDLDNYGYRTVVTNGKGALVFQNSPDGTFMNDYQYNDGDRIYVNLDWRQDGYAIAYQNGTYGYVDAKYIDWGSSSYSGGSSKKNLSNYGYRTVNTGGRGNLVFQSSPNGSFMNDYQYSDGEQIYVNLDWRSEGYAIAYEDGVYGYVDASYIDWGGSSYSGSGKKNLSNYGYRTVDTGGRGALVFQSSPNGSFMNDYQYRDGERIYVNLDWRSDGYAIAYEDGVYGYVDASYIDWGSSSYSSSSKKNLSNYGYRTVATDGRGNLVFQSSPNGSFMNDYQYRDGDLIYVNLNWRQDGYAIAYEDGVYGYVDAGYILW